MTKAYRQPSQIRADFHLADKLPWVILDPRIERLAQYCADLEVALDLSRRSANRLRDTLAESEQATVEANKALESGRLTNAVAFNLIQTLLEWDGVRGTAAEAQAMADLREAITMFDRERLKA